MITNSEHELVFTPENFWQILLPIVQMIDGTESRLYFRFDFVATHLIQVYKRAQVRARRVSAQQIPTDHQLLQVHKGNTIWIDGNPTSGYVLSIASNDELRVQPAGDAVAANMSSSATNGGEAPTHDAVAANMFSNADNGEIF